VFEQRGLNLSKAKNEDTLKKCLKTFFKARKMRLVARKESTLNCLKLANQDTQFDLIVEIEPGKKDILNSVFSLKLNIDKLEMVKVSGVRKGEDELECSEDMKSVGRMCLTELKMKGIKVLDSGCRHLVDEGFLN
jgi:hypothetical protein